MENTTLPWEIPQDALQPSVVDPEAVPVSTRAPQDDHRVSIDIYDDETLLSHFRDTCRWQKRLHDRYRNLSDCSAAAVVGLTTVAGIFTVILPLLRPESDVIPIVTGSVSILGGALGALARSLNLEVKSSQHNNYSAESDFIKTVQHRMNRLDDGAPSIPTWVQKSVGHPSSRQIEQIFFSA
eukprot:jgi/Tetstr1/457659/TSEL_004240.t1